MEVRKIVVMCESKAETFCQLVVKKDRMNSSEKQKKWQIMKADKYLHSRRGSFLIVNDLQLLCLFMTAEHLGSAMPMAVSLS